MGGFFRKEEKPTLVIPNPEYENLSPTEKDNVIAAQILQDFPYIGNREDLSDFVEVDFNEDYLAFLAYLYKHNLRERTKELEILVNTGLSVEEAEAAFYLELVKQRNVMQHFYSMWEDPNNNEMRMLQLSALKKVRAILEIEDEGTENMATLSKGPNKDQQVLETVIVRPEVHESFKTQFNFIDEATLDKVIDVFFKGNVKAAQAYFEKESYYEILRGQAELVKAEEIRKVLVRGHEKEEETQVALMELEERMSYEIQKYNFRADSDRANLLFKEYIIRDLEEKKYDIEEFVQEVANTPMNKPLSLRITYDNNLEQLVGKAPLNPNEVDFESGSDWSGPATGAGIKVTLWFLWEYYVNRNVHNLVIKIKVKSIKDVFSSWWTRGKK